ncbi:DNA-binding protein [Geoanaerobacter pelophilus]|uniref:DNA-binding protein n=1 Tax=Geoanaerobacter pelophilus TaxID=60036 RepID=A0ABQ0MLR4_9BACT|nr:DNA-binding protein [Geoanaerobacter pelophilus]
MATLSAALVAAPVFATPWQQWRGSGGWGMGSAYQRMYDPAKVETVAGEVVGVDEVSMGKGPKKGIHLKLKTDQGTIPVHLGPSWYLERQDTRIATGDRVEVKGAKVEFGGKPAIIAAEVKKGDEVLILRDAAGVPAWAGWRRR